MGVLSELVVAPAGEAERVAQAEVPSQTFDGIDISGVDTVKFGTLHSILTGQSFEELLPLYDPVATVSEDDGPWVFQIPTELVTRLAALDDAGMAGIARQWAATEEFVLEGWGEDEAASVLSAISSQSKRAIESGQALFLWMSL